MPPGEYYLAASPALGPGSARSDAETYYPGTVNVAEAQPVRLGVGQETYVAFSIASAPPARLRGVIIGSTGGPLPNPTASLQMVYLGSGSSRRLSIAPDGSFNEEYLRPATTSSRCARPSGPCSASGSSARTSTIWSSRRYFGAFGNKPIEVRLTQRATRVTGTALDAKGQPSGTYVAVLFPEDRQQWTPYSRAIAAARPDQQGRFVVEGVPPGRYLLAAVEYLQPGEERYAGTLERLRRVALPVTLADGESRTVDLKIVQP